MTIKVTKEQLNEKMTELSSDAVPYQLIWKNGQVQGLETVTGYGRIMFMIV